MASRLVPLQDEGALEQLTKTDSETREVVREMRQKVDEAKSSRSSNRSRGRVLDALMQQKTSGRIPGIFGRLVNRCYKMCITLGTNIMYGRPAMLYIIAIIIPILPFTNLFSEIKSRSLIICYLFCACRETLEPSMRCTTWPFPLVVAPWTTSSWIPLTQPRNVSCSSKSKTLASPPSLVLTR